MEQKEFEKLVAEGIDAIPERFTKKLNNVVITVEDAPSPEQLATGHVHPGWTLFGLYQGIPQTMRQNYTMVLPDKITIFKDPILTAAGSDQEIREIVATTVWHEIAHHFGLDEAEVRRREQARQNRQATST